MVLQLQGPKDRQNDAYGVLHTSGTHCTGRITLNIWRIVTQCCIQHVLVPTSAYILLAQATMRTMVLQFLSPKDRQNDEYGVLHASGIHCTGRIVLNVWRILRSELKLNIYTFESCVAAVLQLRTPHVQPHVLTQWFNGGPAGVVHS